MINSRKFILAKERNMRKRLAFWAVSTLLLSVSLWSSISRASGPATIQKHRTRPQAMVRAASRGNPRINLQDGLEAATGGLNEANGPRRLKQDQAQPRALATADFDEDGVPDLV